MMDSELLLTEAVCMANRAAVIRLLAKGCDPDERDEDGETPLFEAVRGDLEMTQLLVERGADVNARDDSGMTVLMVAVSVIERFPEIVQFLITSGANVNARSLEGYTALHCAIDVDFETYEAECTRRVLTTLVKAGADLEAKQDYGWTPLVRAVMEGTAIEVETLLELGADPFVRGFECFNFCPTGGALLHAAAAEPDKLSLLIDAGLDLQAKANNGQTVLDCARRHLEEIESAFAKMPRKEQDAPFGGDLIAEMFDELFSAFPDLAPEAREQIRERIMNREPQDSVISNRAVYMNCRDNSRRSVEILEAALAGKSKE